MTASDPAPAAMCAFHGTDVRAMLSIDGADVDEATVTSDNVLLENAETGGVVPATVRLVSQDDAIVLSPDDALAAHTSYVFRVTSGVLDEEGRAFVPYRAEFRTGEIAGSDYTRSYVSSSTPSAGATNVFLDTGVTTVLNPGGVGVHASSANLDTVRLYRTEDGEPMDGNVIVSGADDSITFQPFGALRPNTQYTFEVTEGVLDKTCQSFRPYRIDFTTGEEREVEPADVAFSRTRVYSGPPIASVAIGPDGRLYGTGLDGLLRRWTILEDGTLDETSEEAYEGLAGRPMIGLAFDPRDEDVIWVSHNGPLVTSASPDFTGAIARITVSGSNLSEASHRTVVERLPRSAGDHMTNSLAFGPDGYLYVTQGSNTGAGAPDSYWGFRPERLLSATVLQIDTDLLPTSGALNVQTENYDEDGSTGAYDPYAAGAAVRIYATGVRNAYDLVWHSDGHLYVPTNGGNGFGSAPATPAGVTPSVPYLERVPTQPDFLFDVVEGGYYGHPNESRGEYVLNGGNPTSGVDPAEVVDTVESYEGNLIEHDGYPIGIDPTWEGFVYQFNNNASVNGVIEYRNDVFGDNLAGRLLVVRYANGGDILALDVDDGTFMGITGVAEDFVEPLDLVEDVRNGNLYVASLPTWTDGEIHLLKPEVEQ